MDTRAPRNGEVRRAAYQANYRKLNTVINDIIFDGRFSMMPVYLDIENELLQEIALRMEVPAAELDAVLGSTVSLSLNWDVSDPYAWHLSEMKAWSQLGRVTKPPFTALLCALSLAAEHMREDGEYTSSNYYERLFEVLQVTDTYQQTSLRLHAKSTKRFWSALNKWLTENDFEFGRPTAKQINHWEYVSYAISQALVREADRKRFHNMFGQFGLSPKERLTDTEIACYLEQWMPGAGPSPWLKKLWSVSDLKVRVASAARAELEVWDGAQRSRSNGPVKSALTLAASFSAFPRQQLRLFISAGIDGRSEPHQLKLASGSSGAAKQAFAEVSCGIWLTPLIADGFSVLEPTREISVSPLMLASFELEDAVAQKTLKRVARPVIPLAKLDSSVYFREVSRISLLRQHMILCHSQWAPRVRELLTLCARMGFKESSGGTLPGLPADWTLFREVELTRIPLSTSDNLQVLVPLAEDAALEITGGIKLAQNIWHSAALPEVTGSCDRGPVTLSVCEHAFEKDPVVVGEKQSSDNSVRIALSRLDLEDGKDLWITLSQGSKKRAEASVVLRSADMPRRLATLKTAGAAYLLNPYDGRSADTISLLGSNDSGVATVRGMVFDGPATLVAVAEPDNPSLGPLIGSSEEDEPAAAYRQTSPVGLQETCVLKGHHIWVCEEFRKGDEPKEARWMTCNQCGNSVLTRNRGAVRRGWNLRPASRGKAPASPQMIERKREPARPDLLFDAICYLGGGSWDRLRDLVTSSAENTWFGPRFSAALADLGHMDVMLRPGSMHEESWLCAQPAVTFTAPTTAFLSGFRSGALVQGIKQAVEQAGGRLGQIDQGDGPKALIITGCSAVQLSAALTEVRDPFGRKIEIQDSPALYIAASHPAASRMLEAMPVIHVGDFQGLERFDPGRGKWLNSKGVTPLSGYRTTFAGRRYFFCDDTGHMKEGPYSLVKLLAAWSANQKLHAYDPANQSFKAVIGCEPPGLLRRALVSCSGLLPNKQGNVIVYRNVSPSVAATVMHKLYT